MSSNATARHILVAQAIDKGYAFRSEIQRHCELDQNAALISLKRLTELELVDVEEGVFRENQRRRYTLAVPLLRAIEALRPSKDPEWTDTLDQCWKAPVGIPTGTVSATHVVGW